MSSQEPPAEQIEAAEALAGLSQPPAEQIEAAETLAGLSQPPAEQMEAASALASLSELQPPASPPPLEQEAGIEQGEPQLTEAQRRAVEAAITEFSEPIELPPDLRFDLSGNEPGEIPAQSEENEEGLPAPEGLPQPEFVGGPRPGAAERNQRMKSKYICVGSSNSVSGTEVRPKYQDKWQPLGYNSFNPKEYWEHMEKFKRGEEPAPPPLPNLFYFSMIQGSNRVRRNDLKKKQVQRCIGLLKPCAPGENCPGQLNNTRTSTMQGKRVNPSVQFQERIRTGDIVEPPRIVGCLVADDDLGGKSRGDAAPFREFKPARDPATGKLMPIPPDNLPIDVCTEEGFRNFIANEQPYIPDKPIPGETIPQAIVNKDNGIFTNHPFEISLYFFILKSLKLLQPEVFRNAQFIQLLIDTELPEGGPARKIRQFYIEPGQVDLRLPSNLAELNVDFSKGIQYWNERRDDLEATADQIGTAGPAALKEQFVNMMRLSFQGGNEDVLKRKLKQMLTRGQPAVFAPAIQGPVIPIIPLEDLAIVQPEASAAAASAEQQQQPEQEELPPITPEIVLEEGPPSVASSPPAQELLSPAAEEEQQQEPFVLEEGEAANFPLLLLEEMEKEELPESEIPVEQPVPGSEGPLQSPSESSSLESLAVQTPEVTPPPEQPPVEEEIEIPPTPPEQPPVEEEIEIPLENM